MVQLPGPPVLVRKHALGALVVAGLQHQPAAGGDARPGLDKRRLGVGQVLDHVP